MNKKGEEDRERPLQSYERPLSDKMCVSISVFKPKAEHLISVHLRGYFYNSEGIMKFLRFPGITLNTDQFKILQRMQVRGYTAGEGNNTCIRNIARDRQNCLYLCMYCEN